jgi:uncharacterized membrane protein
MVRMPTRHTLFNPYTPQFGCLCLVIALCSLCLVPLLVLDFMEKALNNLHITGPLASLTILGIIIGSLINLPLYRVNRHEQQPVMRGYMVPGLGWVPLPRAEQQTIVAVNVGGCIIPVLLALYEARIVADVREARVALLVAVAINIAVCFWFARPIRGIGIAIPAFLPPLLAIGSAWLLLGNEPTSELRAPVAFIAGVAGPLVGADLLNLRRFQDLHTGILSIGGAGTFDGIVISSLAAAFFA